MNGIDFAKMQARLADKPLVGFEASAPAASAGSGTDQRGLAKESNSKRGILKVGDSKRGILKLR